MTSPHEPPVVEGYSFGLFTRICGLFCFCILNPLFVYLWIDSPKFVKGPVDFPEVFMAVVTLGMLALGFCGLMINFAKTRITADGIGWGVFRRCWLPFESIAYVETVIVFNVWFIHAVSIMHLVSRDSRKLEITGGTADLYQTFLWLESRYPK